MDRKITANLIEKYYRKNAALDINYLDQGGIISDAILRIEKIARNQHEQLNSFGCPPDVSWSITMKLIARLERYLNEPDYSRLVSSTNDKGEHNDLD